MPTKVDEYEKCMSMYIQGYCRLNIHFIFNNFNSRLVLQDIAILNECILCNFLYNAYNLICMYCIMRDLRIKCFKTSIS